MGPGCFTCCLCLCLCLCLFLSARIGHLGLQAREAAGRRRDLMLQEERSRREANTFFAVYVSRVILILTKLLHGFKWFYFVQIVRNSFCFRYRIFIYAVRNFLGFTDFKWNNLKPCRRWTNQIFSSWINLLFDSNTIWEEEDKIGSKWFTILSNKLIKKFRLRRWKNQRPQPTQIIWLCPDIWVCLVFTQQTFVRHLSHLPKV